MAEPQPSKNAPTQISPRPSDESAPPAHAPVKKENPFLNIGFNLVLPILILNKGEKWFGSWLEPRFENAALPVLVIALLFPVGYFVYDYFKRAKYNLFSILGLVSVLLTGGIGLLAIPTGWFAVKEAAIPALLGLAVIVSLKTPWPLVRTLLYNPEILDVDKVQTALRERGSEAAFERLLARCTWLLAASFLVSAVLNYVLARWIVVSPSGTEAFNNEVGKMMALSWPVIFVPSMLIMIVALWQLLGGIRRMTGLTLEDVVRGASEG